ncbi:ubiquitin carboxyl-terminal hydrolase CYLD-like protein [Labeo rohita]|nr:ubiquitin carboxyl-terminal hydrolase CYLD-like protein [Labeo rohita]
MFLPVSDLTLPRSSRGGSSGDNDRHPHQSNHAASANGQNPVNILSRAAESSPNPGVPQPFAVGQRVCFTRDECVQRGSVQFCGPLSHRAPSAIYVGVLLDQPGGSWDGYYKNTKLCSIPSPDFGALLPLSKVTPESRSERSPLAVTSPKPLPQLPPLPVSNKAALQPPSPSKDPSQPTTTPANRPLIQPSMLVTAKKALQPPSSSVPKAALKPPPLNTPKPALLPPVVLPNKPQAPPMSPPIDQSRSSNGFHNLLSPAVAEQKAEFSTWLEVGSMVEVNDPPLFGVIRWIGQINNIPEPVAGIELDQELSAATDGSYLGERHFRCPANKGLFVKLRNCRRDSRFPEPELPINQVDRCNSIAFANWSSKRVEDHTPPLSGPDARLTYEGFKKGIQGHLNSCYLDASLFSSFDWLLFWPSGPQNNPISHSAQDLLRCEIVNPLRRSVSQKAQECFIYQLFPPSVSPSSPLVSPASPGLSPVLSPSAGLLRVSSVQALLESSFMHSGLKLTEAPSCLPLLMPRFGKEFKMFDAILPSLSLDITDLLDETLRQCSICQSVAQWECLQCYEDVHTHKKRQTHRPVEVRVPRGCWEGPVHGARQLMDLFAVTCIETSHYVSFVKHGPQPTDWLFFDSMADREGGENGFNVPQVRACPEVGRYLSLSVDEIARLDVASLRDPVRRLLCDAYMCLYHCPQLSLYK